MDIGERVVNAWNRGDVDAVVALYAEDAVWQHPMVPGGVHGRDAIRLWMITAKRGQVVAYRTFLRTLLHEICHHLDYTYLHLRDSLHTQGFYQRESSLFHALGAGDVDSA